MPGEAGDLVAELVKVAVVGSVVGDLVDWLAY